MINYNAQLQARIARSNQVIADSKERSQEVRELTARVEAQTARLIASRKAKVESTRLAARLSDN